MTIFTFSYQWFNLEKENQEVLVDLIFKVDFINQGRMDKWILSRAFDLLYL